MVKIINFFEKNYNILIIFLKDYSLDIFFRQLWIDKRLAFDLSNDGINELVVGADMLQKIWLPDTFIGRILLIDLFKH